MEYGTRQEWEDRSDVFAGEILRAPGRMAICAASQRTRRHQLTPRELRSAGRERADDAAQRRRRNCAGHFGEAFPGHTAHMQAVIINGRPGGSTVEKGTASAVPMNEKDERALAPEGTIACYISDLIPTTAHIDITWGMGFDLYPLQTIDSKKQYYAQAIPEKWLTIFTHDPKMPWAYVERDETGKMAARAV